MRLCKLSPITRLVGQAADAGHTRGCHTQALVGCYGGCDVAAFDSWSLFVAVVGAAGPNKSRLVETEAP